MDRYKIFELAQEKLGKYNIDIDYTDKNDIMYSNYGTYEREDVSIISNDNWEIHVGYSVRLLLLSQHCRDLELFDVVNFYSEIKDLELDTINDMWVK